MERPELTVTITWGSRSIAVNCSNLQELSGRIQEEYLNLALGDSSGCRAQAARMLGINRTTLLMKMRKHGHQLYQPVPRVGAKSVRPV